MTVSTRYRFDGLSAHYRVRQSGTVLILVVVILALMALIGVAYIQVSRTTLMASKKPISGLDAACHSVVGQIQSTLLKDLYSDGTKLFDPSKYLSPYDYPWTNTANDWPTSVTNQEGTPFGTQPKGGRFDDAWLASSCPNFTTDANQPTWPHITNLNGVFLRLPALGAPTGTEILEDPVNFTAGDTTEIYTTHNPNLSYICPDFTKTDKGLFLTRTNSTEENALDRPIDTGGNIDAHSNPYYETLGADADGDGILDSRWTWTPLRRFGNLVYVCAVRIIDNSSMINVNTAGMLSNDLSSGMASSDAYINVADGARGYYPTDIDLSRLAYLFTSGGSNGNLSDIMAANTARGLTNYSLGVALAGYPSSGITDHTRAGDWFNRARYYGKETATNQGVYYSINDELELRHKNGLNNSNSGTVSIKTQMPNLTRSAVTTETYYGNVSGVTADTAGQAIFFQGGPSATNVASRRFCEPRKMLTTRSGAAVYATNPDNVWDDIYTTWISKWTTPGASDGWKDLLETIYGVGLVPPAPTQPSTERYLKYDLLYQDGNGSNNTSDARNTFRMERIGSIISEVFSLGVSGTTTYLGANAATLEQIATEYMLAIKDYNDADLIPSSKTIGTVTYYGIEPILPFIREVYVQTAFTGSDNYTTPWPTAGADIKSDTWTHMGSGSDCFAIELGNPFDRQINCDKVQILIGGATYTIPAGTLIGPRSYRIFYVNPTSDTSDNGTYTSGNLNTSLSLPAPTAFPAHTPVAATLASGTLSLSTNAQLAVELKVDVGGGTYVTYDRLTDPTFILENTTFTAANSVQQGTAANTGRHRQVRLTRACNSANVSSGGVHYLSNKNRQMVSRTLPTDASYISNNTTVSKFGSDSKGVTGDAKLDGFMMPVPNRPFFSVAELGKILMIGFTDEATGDLPQRLSGADGAGGFLAGTASTDVSPQRLFLDFTSTAKVPAKTAALNYPLPHAVMLMDQFTTLSPAYDGVNNTTATGSDPAADTNDKQPSEQFVPGLININTAPLHVATLACPLPEAVNNIQSLMSNIASYRDDTSVNGIVSIAELQHAVPAMQLYGSNNADDKDKPINLSPMPEDGGTAVTAIDGANEKLSRFQFLSQVYTTRSDIFTAYVVVRGYRDNDYGKGPVESATFIAVFDRSGVTSSSGTVKLLAYQRIN